VPLGVLLLIVAYLSIKCHRAHQQQQAVAAIRALGGRAIYADEMPHARLTWPLSWVSTRLGHDYAAPIVAVDLGNTAVHDSDLVCLQSLDRLRALWLQNTAVTDDGIRRLQSRTLLEELSLRDTRVGDAGMASLAQLTNLEFLYLQDTKVTDAGLARLASLANLKLLCVPGTEATTDGVRHLQEALPRTRIRY
jgi:hypothetical protein